MYTLNATDGPDFEEGDEVVFTAGVFSGGTGVIAGYDSDNDVYFVRMPGNPFLITALASVIDLVDDEDDEAGDMGELEIGDRVVVVFPGPYLAQAGVVTGPSHPSIPGLPSVRLLLDSGEEIDIAESSVMVSIYQGEPLEVVPSV